MLTKLREHRGFTLVELMVGLSLSAIAGAVLFSIFVGSQRMYYDTREMVGDTGDSRVVLGMLAHEIRSAGSDLASANVQTIADAQLEALRLQSDLDGDGVIEFTEPPEDVTYSYDSSAKTLSRDTGVSGPITLLEDVTMYFEYMDKNGTVVGPPPLDSAQRATVRTVVVHVRRDHPNGTYDTMQTSISLRNSN